MRKLDKIPHIVEMRLDMAINQQLICNRIGWTEQNYCDFKFRAGCDFIDKVLYHSEHQDKRILRHSKTFWGWWANQWHSRDIALYDGRILSSHLYRAAHTTNVQQCSFTINNFWERIETMHEDGCLRLYGEGVA